MFDDRCELPVTSVLTDTDRAFIEGHRVARLATVDTDGAPHVLPICFVIIADTLYLTIDRKPKSGDARNLKRLRNIAGNPRTAVVVDRYDDDWAELGWVMLRGQAEIIESGPEHVEAQTALKDRYPQYRAMHLSDLPVIALRVDRVTRWGNLKLA